ncbi:hypothetical protein [Arvimicrobium flavum]|uniref:hypothetical protein n=1 Tax=Arvimicrobium flavum TaxID=3393320 RepID=UPI00237A2B5F|nr:hypothetical protein [Mesorhizobium shangrilense]
MRFVALILALLAYAAPSAAANITASASNECRLRLDGEIGPGDYQRFLDAARSALRGLDGESTSRDVVCLNSPGGSLSEGVLFAKHFYEKGIGTVVGDGDHCYSVCAVMFMMGIASGPEVSFINRKLHIRGFLGFHRPYLDVRNEGYVQTEFLAAAYDAAFQSALNLLTVANSKSPWSNAAMMKSDLLHNMLKHIGDDLYMIDTVDKAGRWDIELFGFASPSLLTPAQAFYACENGLQWQTGVTDGEIEFEFLSQGATPQVRIVDSTPGGQAYEVRGLADGYAAEGCIVSTDQDSLLACGEDEYTSTILGDGSCDETNFREKRSYRIPPIAIFSPGTKIVDLAAVAGTKGTCFVLKKDVVTDREPCDISLSVDEGKQVTSFVWPSGGKTIVTVSNGNVRLNGVITALQPKSQYGTCLLNIESGNDFCYKPAS